MMKTGSAFICSIWAVSAIGIFTMGLSNPAFALGPRNLERQAKVDDRLDPLTQNQRDLRQKALEAKLQGKAFGRVLRDQPNGHIVFTKLTG